MFLCHTYTPLAVGVQHGAGHVFGIDEETVRREAERIEGIAGVQDQILVGAGEVVGGLVLIVEDLGAGDLIGVDAVVGRVIVTVAPASACCRSLKKVLLCPASRMVLPSPGMPTRASSL